MQVHNVCCKCVSLCIISLFSLYIIYSTNTLTSTGLNILWLWRHVRISILRIRCNKNLCNAQYIFKCIIWSDKNKTRMRIVVSSKLKMPLFLIGVLFWNTILFRQLRGNEKVIDPIDRRFSIRTSSSSNRSHKQFYYF